MSVRLCIVWCHDKKIMNDDIGDYVTLSRRDNSASWQNWALTEQPSRCSRSADGGAPATSAASRCDATERCSVGQSNTMSDPACHCLSQSFRLIFYLWKSPFILTHKQRKCLFGSSDLSFWRLRSPGGAGRWWSCWLRRSSWCLQSCSCCSRSPLPVAGQAARVQ